MLRLRLEYTTVYLYMHMYKIRQQIFTMRCYKVALLLNTKFKGLTTCSFLLQKWICYRLHSLCRTNQDHSRSPADSQPKLSCFISEFERIIWISQIFCSVVQYYIQQGIITFQYPCSWKKVSIVLTHSTKGLLF